MKTLVDTEEPEARALSAFFRGEPVLEVPRERGCRWYVGRVKSQRDSVFANELKAKRITFVQPRTHAGDLLFPSYIFLLINVADFWRCRDSKRMWTWWTPDRGGQKFLREDLQRILIASQVLPYVYTAEDFRIGQEVEIVSPHIMAGVRGYVDKRSSNRIQLRMALMMQAAVFQIDARFLKPVVDHGT